MSKSDLSVVIPYHNEAKSIQMTLELVKAQSLKPDEVFMVNSSSTDNSSQIVDEWIAKQAHQEDIRFHNIYEGTNTPSSSKNAGIKRTQTKWVAFMDCGQVFQKEWLEKQMKYLKAHPDCQWVSGQCYFSGLGIIDRCAIAHTYGHKRARPTIPSSIMRKDLFDRFGPFLENRRAGYDAAWPLLMAKNKIKRGVNPQVEIRYENVNFAKSPLALFKKSFNYAAPTVNMPYYYIPYYYLSAALMIILLALLVPSFLGIALLVYILLRGIGMALLKSRDFSILKDILFLPLVAMIIDSGRMLGILKGVYLYHVKAFFAPTHNGPKSDLKGDQKSTMVRP